MDLIFDIVLILNIFYYEKRYTSWIPRSSIPWYQCGWIFFASFNSKDRQNKGMGRKRIPILYCWGIFCITSFLYWQTKNYWYWWKSSEIWRKVWQEKIKLIYTWTSKALSTPLWFFKIFNYFKICLDNWHNYHLCNSITRINFKFLFWSIPCWNH